MIDDDRAEKRQARMRSAYLQGRLPEVDLEIARLRTEYQALRTEIARGPQPERLDIALRRRLYIRQRLMILKEERIAVSSEYKSVSIASKPIKPAAPYPGERSYDGQWPIRYVLKKAPKGPRKLIVAFSAFPALNKPPRYYSIKLLSDIPCHQLFILDEHGPHQPFPRGSYYLGPDRSLSVATCVASLIESTLKKLDLQPSDVIAVGSSKGGSAALYFGARLGFGAVVAGEPQTKLGQFLVDNPINHQVARYIAGGIDADSVAWLDDLLFATLAASTNLPRIYLQAGAAGRHMEEHVSPLVQLMERLNGSYEVTESSNIEHDDLALHFPQFLRQKVLELLAT